MLPPVAQEMLREDKRYLCVLRADRMEHVELRNEVIVDWPRVIVVVCFEPSRVRCRYQPLTPPYQDLLRWVFFVVIPRWSISASWNCS